MKTIVLTGKQTDTFKGSSVRGIEFTLNLVHGTANTAFSAIGSLVDLSKATVKVILNRLGKETIICSDNLKNLAYISAINSSNFEYVVDPSKHLLTLAAASGVKSTGIIPCYVDFGGVINLSQYNGQHDELHVEVDINDGFFVSGMDSTCSVVFDKIEGIGLEYVTPIIRSKGIEASQTNPTYQLGSNITKLVIANYDKQSLLAADKVISSLSLTSDKFRLNDDWNSLITKNLIQFDSDASGCLRYQNFIIHNSNVDLDDVELSLTLNSGNVTAGKNYILYRTFETNDFLVTIASLKEEKHNRKAMQKASVSPKILNAFRGRYLKK